MGQIYSAGECSLAGRSGRVDRPPQEARSLAGRPELDVDYCATKTAGPCTRCELSDREAERHDVQYIKRPCWRRRLLRPHPPSATALHTGENVRKATGMKHSSRGRCLRRVRNPSGAAAESQGFCFLAWKCLVLAIVLPDSASNCTASEKEKHKHKRVSHRTAMIYAFVHDAFMLNVLDTL